MKKGPRDPRASRDTKSTFCKRILKDELVAVFEKGTWETPPHRNSSNGAELTPTVQTFFEQYRIDPHSAEILPTLQNWFPQYRKSSSSTELLPTVQK